MPVLDHLRLASAWFIEMKLVTFGAWMNFECLGSLSLVVLYESDILVKTLTVYRIAPIRTYNFMCLLHSCLTICHWSIYHEIKVYGFTVLCDVVGHVPCKTLYLELLSAHKQSMYHSSIRDGQMGRSGLWSGSPWPMMYMKLKSSDEISMAWGLHIP